ncbi:hypothetical protein HMPREF0290_2487 [Corynebacterium efficiens YS-314]|nr:hypothetical protein HMPREF0290_2487 [Corynebacterium efficiens YS-314]
MSTVSTRRSSLRGVITKMKKSSFSSHRGFIMGRDHGSYSATPAVLNVLNVEREFAHDQAQ